MKLLPGSILALALIGSISQLHADDYFYEGNGADGNFDNSTNWLSLTTGASSPGHPNSTDTALIEPGLSFQNEGGILVGTQGGQNPLPITSLNDYAVGGLDLAGFTFFNNNTGDFTTSDAVLNLTFNTGTTASTATTLTINSNMDVTGGITTNYSGNITFNNSTTLFDTLTIGDTNFNGPSNLNLTNGLVNLDTSASATNTIDVGFGATGTLTQGSESIVDTGSFLVIGSADANNPADAGNGTYNVTGGATLNIGGPTPLATSYTVLIGTGGAGSTGLLTIQNSTFNAVNANTTIKLGNGTGDQG